MASRASNGRAKVYLGADGRFHGFVSMGVKDDGSPDRRHRTGKTQGEVTAKVRALERQRDAGHVANTGRSPKFGAWMTDEYLDIASRRVAPSTLRAYESLAETWIVPHLGQHRLDRLQPEHLDRLYARMAAAGKASATVLKVHRVISRALEIAVRRGKVARNVAKLVDAPSVTQTEIEPLSAAEARRLLTAAQTVHNGARWSVGLALGLRQGEALGLRWRYVDLAAGTARIWWQLQRNRWRHGCADPRACGRHTRTCAKDCVRHAKTCPQRRGGGLVFREPKGRSKRVVTLPAPLVEALRAHRDSQDAERTLAANCWRDNDLVFAQPNGAPIDPRRDWAEWKALLQAAGVRDARVHDGRHTAGTLLIEQGVHVRTVMEILGHSDLRLAQRYTHVASPAAEDAAARMGRALWD